QEAIALGAEYVDVEWRAHFDDLLTRANAPSVVLSLHDFAGVPPDLPQQVDAMQATGAGAIKIAVKANGLADCAPLLDVRARVAPRTRVVALAMGEYGFATRVLARRFGSAWTYAGAI